MIHRYNETGGTGQWIYQATVLCTSSAVWPAQIALMRGDFKAQYFDEYEEMRSAISEFSIVKEVKEIVVPAPTLNMALIDTITLNVAEEVTDVKWRLRLYKFVFLWGILY